ncbi:MULTISPECIES: hypothetical protein [unclassified Streptomyces]|uniref:hypothetical protein n=1 Tax=unclassified Streptomyces TaxID=2593676 RepID=UPI0034507987
MVVGPEATVVAKAAGNVLRGVSDRATSTPAWPNMHEALMELHEILNDWCEAARKTSEALEQLRTHHLTRRFIAHIGGGGNGAGPRPVTFIGLPLRRGYIEIAQRDIDAVLAPPAPLIQRWSTTKRRQAARRSLRSLMSIYCAELLDDFDRAVEGRVDWVECYRDDMDRALKHGLQPEDLVRMIQNTTRTTRELVAVRDDMKRLIQECYPMGSTDAQTATG